MADRTALGVIGYILGGVTATVMLIGLTVVNTNRPDSSQIVPGYYDVSLSARSH
jgi:hypothetical protein